MNLAEAATEMARLAAMLEAALEFHKQYVHEYAHAEETYREAKSRAWVNITEGTAKEREAHVDGATAKQRRDRDIADGMKYAALEAIRSRRAQISALQSLLSAEKAEAEFVRTGP